MPRWAVSNDFIFPDVSEADEEGLLLIGGSLSVDRLQDAYSRGIFPWYNPGEPVLWWSPDPRFVLFPEEVYQSSSMKKILRRGTFQFSWNKDFTSVIHHCRHIDRPGYPGTWITDEMEWAYNELHQQGQAQSLEVWQDDTLVGGLYGVVAGRTFAAESMFSKVSNASKAALIHLCQNLPVGIELIDCQVYSHHVAGMGAREIPREEFLKYLR